MAKTVFSGMKQRIKKIYWKEILAIFLLLLAIYFFRSQRQELASIIPHLRKADPKWLSAGLFVTVMYIFFQTAMYVSGFAAVGAKLSWLAAIELFLKRNLLSVFLPAGGVSSLGYIPSRVRKSLVTTTQVHQASAIYAFAGIATVFVIGVPLLLYAISNSAAVQGAWIGLGFVAVMLLGLLLIARSLQQKAGLYRLIQRKFPSVIPAVDELFGASVSGRKVGGTLMSSMAVELTGILHVYIAMMALGLHASFVIAAIAYVVSVLLMIASPFLRGLGAVELSMVYVLGLYGFSPADALAITILYRLFEFWLPLAAGFLSFAWKGKELFIRLFPAILVFALGVVNIISVVTPPIAARLRILKEFIPSSSIQESNLLVLFLGLTLIVTSAFLLRGLRNAWRIALVFASISLVGHIAKALDYEEATLAAFTIMVLLATVKQYRIKGHPRTLQVSLMTVGLVFLSVLIFGFIGFYFVAVKHFGIDFTWKQSITYSAKSFLLLTDDELKPVTRFGREFIYMMNGLGLVAWAFLLFTIIRPYLQPHSRKDDRSLAMERAKDLLERYGNSPVDYFKTNPDKLLFFSDACDAFIAYRIANGFAIVLEEPVCAAEDKIPVLQEFDDHCKKMGLKTAFYRVDENSMPYFNALKKRKLLIGQEAILDVSTFSLEGRDKKALRNSLNSLQKKGYTTVFYKAHHPLALMEELKTVSDEWLQVFDKKEMGFAQGVFDQEAIMQQDVIGIRDSQERLVAFMTIIPDFAPGECTYDLIRRTADAPGGCMDALLIELVRHAQANTFRYLNLGLVPMSGIQQPDSTAERVVKYAYEKIRRFRHYQGLREFKEKYASAWVNKYLVYENDFDLLQLPAALNKVMQPAAK
ncbi:MAG TPA: phosphatidylglycerol lysyltransferase domain-containing protein [Chitinophagaceae bacterium]|nr:phosphatidylglycerol lysyltransferase domain-containing protein [Chitinophagaceae bacterium]